MPNRLERINGQLVWKNQAGTIAKDSVQTFPDYSYSDDFGYTTDAQVDLKYVAQSADTLSYVATGTQDATDTSAGTAAGFIISGAGNQVDPTKKLTIKARVSLTLDDEELFAHIGAFETNPTIADPPVLANDYIAFEMIETTLDTNWQAICGEDFGGSGDETVVDTGVEIDLLPHDFEIVLDGGLATFKIDGVKVASIDTNIPLEPLTTTVKVTTGDGDSKGISADVLSVVNAR